MLVIASFGLTDHSGESSRLVEPAESQLGISLVVPRSSPSAAAASGCFIASKTSACCSLYWFLIHCRSAVIVSASACSLLSAIGLQEITGEGGEGGGDDGGGGGIGGDGVLGGFTCRLCTIAGPNDPTRMRQCRYWLLAVQMMRYWCCCLLHIVSEQQPAAEERTAMGSAL